jgi:hypothetical protein
VQAVQVLREGREAIARAYLDRVRPMSGDRLRARLRTGASTRPDDAITDVPGVTVGT